MSEMPHVTMNYGDKPYLLTPENTAVFQFASWLGDLALRDHCFLVLDEENEQYMHLFRRDTVTGEDIHPNSDLMDVLLEKEFPNHSGQTEVSDFDEDAFKNHDRACFERHAMEDLEHIEDLLDGEA